MGLWAARDRLGCRCARGGGVAPALRDRLGPRALLGALGCSGLLLALVAAARDPWSAAALLGLALVPESAAYLLFVTRSQEVAPRAITGRYFGVVQTALAALLPLGALLGGLLVAGVGARAGIALVGLGLAAAAGGGFVAGRRDGRDGGEVMSAETVRRRPYVTVHSLQYP